MYIPFGYFLFVTKVTIISFLVLLGLFVVYSVVTKQWSKRHYVRPLAFLVGVLLMVLTITSAAAATAFGDEPQRLIELGACLILTIGSFAVASFWRQDEAGTADPTEEALG